MTVDSALLAILQYLPDQKARAFAQDILDGRVERTRLRYQKLVRMIQRVPKQKRLVVDVNLETYRAEKVLEKEMRR